jgi:hypothetical protein
MCAHSKMAGRAWPLRFGPYGTARYFEMLPNRDGTERLHDYYATARYFKVFTEPHQLRIDHNFADSVLIFLEQRKSPSDIFKRARVGD